MKVLIDRDWREFPIEFTHKMPDEIGGIGILSEPLAGELDVDIGYIVYSLSIVCHDCGSLLLAQYEHYGTEDFVSYRIQLSPEEYHTYTNLFC